MTHALVVLFALLAALCMAIGIVVRQRATMDVPYDQGVSATMVTALIRKPLWWAGTGAAVGGYGFQALALANGSLLLVQPLLVSSLLFTLPISAHLADRRVTRTEWTWALVLTVGLAIFVLMANTQPGEYRATVVTKMLILVVLVPLVIGLVALGARGAGWRRAVPLAVAVGVLFGVTAVLTKIVMQLYTDGGLMVLLTKPTVYVLVALGVVATVLQQSAFHAGSLKTSVPTILMLEPVVAVLLGGVLLGEHLDVSNAEAAALAVAVAAMAAATIALGRDEGAYEEELEAVVTRRAP